jgi:hypothetical protein
MKPLCEFDKCKTNKDGLHYQCKTCRKEYNIKNRERKRLYNQAYFEKNKLDLLVKNKKYREENAEKIRIQKKGYRERMVQHIKMQNKKYLPIKKLKIKERRKNDKNFQISEILRSKVNKMLKGRNTTYINIIGCDIVTLKSWLEFRFDNTMSWENLGSYWQIDHILPINQFNFSRELDQKVCFNWTNLQPLLSSENRKKSDKLQLHHYFNSIISVHRFIQKKQLDITEYQNVKASLHWLREKLRYGKNLCNGGQSAANFG